MSYLGILDGMEINGESVDTSRLEETGKVYVGDEEYDPNELIGEEDRLSVFEETSIRTKDEILLNLDLFIRSIEKDSKMDTKHSSAYYSRYMNLVERFRAKVEDTVLPENLEDWWSYEYEVQESGITLCLIHTSGFALEADDSTSACIDASFELIHVKAGLLTVEQYAQANGVTATTVRQWIRRGKIRTAIKQGNEWKIPELAEVRERGYRYASYERKEYLTDLPAEYSYFNEYDRVLFSQNPEHKDLFDVRFVKDLDGIKYEDLEDKEKYFKDIQIGQKEREKFELYLIANPFVTVSDAIIACRG